MADYAQNESNRQMLAERYAQHLTGDDVWANNFTREKLLDVIANAIPVARTGRVP